MQAKPIDHDLRTAPECQKYCWGQYPWVLFVSLAVTLDCTETPFAKTPFSWFLTLVAHDCGYPLSRYTCRATRVAADFLDFIAFCRCSSGVALHPLKILVSHLAPPAVPGGVAPKFGSEKVSRYTGVSQLQLRVSRYTVQLS